MRQVPSSQIAALSLCLQAIGYLALIKLTSVISLMLTMFFIGLATYSFITANYLWVLNQSTSEEAHRLKAINLLSTASNLGLEFLRWQSLNFNVLVFIQFLAWPAFFYLPWQFTYCYKKI